MNQIVFERGRQIGRIFAERQRCLFNTLEHAHQYGYGFNLDDIARIEAAFERLRPAFVQPGQPRHRIVARVRGQRITFIYDCDLHCLVTCRPAARLATGTVPLTGGQAHE
jgi:hypothetical protein